MLRILIISDDPLARSGLGAILATQPEVTVAAHMATDADMMQAMDVYSPNAIVWDFGLEVSKSLEHAHEVEDVPLLALVNDERDARTVWGGSVHGVLNRGASAAQIASAIISISNGLFILDPGFGSLLSPARTDGGNLSEPLTPREMQVLQLVARGLANKNIGQELEISEHTVKFHMNSILAKLGAASRTDAVVRATRLGLITL